jgi:uncharacterized protein YbaP (TraB family)
MRKLISLFLLVILLIPWAQADTIYLKNGKVVEGSIKEKTNEYIKLDVGGLTIKYLQGEIGRIESEERIAKNFLWRAESGINKVYILGSIHLAKKELYPLNETIEDAFRDSSVLVVEVNLNNMDPLTIQRKLTGRGMYYGNQTLKDHLSAETYALLAEKLAALDSDISLMNRYKPWFLALSLGTFQALKLGFDPKYGIDQHFLRMAKRDNKKILEFESFDYQLSIFDGFGDREQELFLFSTLLELDTIESEINSLFSAWKTGDAVSLERILNKSLKENPEILPIYDVLFTKRNKNMVSKIEGFLKDSDNYFVVVGAGHLVGRTGIIQLLSKKGYYLEQI